MNNIVDFVTIRKKADDTMCEPINKIHGKSATEILKEFSDGLFPLDLEKLLKNIGISALPMNFSEIEKRLKSGHISGVVLSNCNNAVIYYNEKDTVNRQRFTIAHELAHISMHLTPDSNDYPYIDWRINENENDKDEVEANIFAGELLIPLSELKEKYLKLKLPNSRDLAMLFGVSINVMEKRLNYLGVSYFNSKGVAIIANAK